MILPPPPERAPVHRLIGDRPPYAATEAPARREFGALPAAVRRRDLRLAGIDFRSDPQETPFWLRGRHRVRGRAAYRAVWSPSGRYVLTRWYALSRSPRLSVVRVFDRRGRTVLARDVADGPAYWLGAGDRLVIHRVSMASPREVVDVPRRRLVAAPLTPVDRAAGRIAREIARVGHRPDVDGVDYRNFPETRVDPVGGRVAWVDELYTVEEVRVDEAMTLQGFPRFAYRTVIVAGANGLWRRSLPEGIGVLGLAANGEALAVDRGPESARRDRPVLVRVTPRAVVPVRRLPAAWAEGAITVVRES